MRVHLILYVADQARSRAFYAQVLAEAPQLDVPGMTEFALPGGAVLGLMPETGIRRLLPEAQFAPPCDGVCLPRGELYLLLPQGLAAGAHARALAAGARELSPLTPRDWGHAAAYALDPDGYILACAEPALNPEASHSSHIID